MHNVEGEVPNNGWVKMGTICQKCRGEKTVDDTTCPECNGTGEKIVDVRPTAFAEFVLEYMSNQARFQHKF